MRVDALDPEDPAVAAAFVAQIDTGLRTRKEQELLERLELFLLNGGRQVVRARVTVDGIERWSDTWDRTAGRLYQAAPSASVEHLSCAFERLRWMRLHLPCSETVVLLAHQPDVKGLATVKAAGMGVSWPTAHTFELVRP